MKNIKSKKIITLFLIVFISFATISWGIFGHEHINKGAVFALPSSLQSFFYNHIDFITEESTVPDLRKSVLKDKAEAPRHYFDMENFGNLDSLPKTLDEAKKKYDEKFLQNNGILPWYIQDMMAKLTIAFKEKRKTEILFIAADLGHYIADAHMPLHTTDNHDGQKTNQKGIHSLWESRLPNLFGKNYNLHTKEATYFENVETATWAMINDTHSFVEPLLLADRNLKLTFDATKLYEKDANGVVVKNKYNESVLSKEYVEAFHKSLNGMVEKQMNKAVLATASFWYTAWVNAGKPDLSDLDSKDFTASNQKNLKRDMNLWKTGKLFGIESDLDAE
jgi:S1/P1 Nuclease